MAYFPRTIMTKAWCVARAAAKRFQAKASVFLAASLRQVWAEVKAAAARHAASMARVQASIDSLAADIAAEAARRAEAPAPVAAVFGGPRPVRRVPFRPRLVADAYAVRETARFRAEADARALGLAA